MSEQKYIGVYKQKNGNWAYRFVVFADGKRIEKKKSRNEEGRPFKTARQAWQARQKAMQEYKVEQALMSTVKPIERKRVKEVYEEYCATGRNDKAYFWL